MRAGEEGVRMRWLDGIAYAINMNLDKLQEMLRGRKAWRAAVHGVTKSLTRLGDGTTATITSEFKIACVRSGESF